MPTIQDSVNTKSFLPRNKSIVTFKDLQKVIESQPGQGLDQLQRLRGKSFWYWDKARHKERDKRWSVNKNYTHT